MSEQDWRGGGKPSNSSILQTLLGRPKKQNDLVQFFGISVPRASLDLAKYQEMAPTNAIYDRTERLAAENFSPVVTGHEAEKYINQLLALNWAICKLTQQIRVDSASCSGESPARTLKASHLRVVLGPLSHQTHGPPMTYQSINQPLPAGRACVASAYPRVLPSA